MKTAAKVRITEVSGEAGNSQHAHAHSLVCRPEAKFAIIKYNLL